MPSAERRSVGSELACGAFGGLVAALATHPLDTIKTRMRSSATRVSAIACFRATVAREGVKGLYRGIAVPVV